MSPWDYLQKIKDVKEVMDPADYLRTTVEDKIFFTKGDHYFECIEQDPVLIVNISCYSQYQDTTEHIELPDWLVPML